MEFEITVPQTPSTNSIWRNINGKTLKSKEYRAYCKTIKKCFDGTLVKPYKGEVSLDIIWYRKIKSGDIDNRLKGLLDSLQGFLYESDSQIAKLSIRRIDGHELKGHMKVRLEPLQ